MKNKKNYNKLNQKLETALNEQLFDQSSAVEKLIKALAQADLLKNKSKIKSLFTFIGSANSGKHYCCELLEQLNPDIKAIKTFYMDQYSVGFNSSSEQQSAINFQNDVIEFAQNNPQAILIFEDLEKADLQIQLSIYTLFTDYEKEEIDFSNNTVVITTTVLSSLLQRKDLQKLLLKDPLQAHTFFMERLSKEEVSIGNQKDDAFDKKLLSLLNEHTLITFNNLSLKALIKIGARSLHHMSQDFIKKSGVVIEYDEFNTLVSLLTLSLSPYLNARHIKQKLPKQMFNHLYDLLKSENNISQVSYTLSSDAKEFVNNALADEQQLLTKITKQHQRVHLEWDITTDENIIHCIIKNASYCDEKLSVTSNEELHISDVSFEDIAGQKKVKKQLNEIITLIKEPERLKHFDLTIPKGMFLYGPIGMGKKLLARAFAKEANMLYIVVSGSDLFDAKKIHQAYSSAYGAAPAIIIFEDIDIQGIIGGVISTMSLEPLIEELDNLRQSFSSPIFTIITLSGHENISEELLQANRIDIHIEVPKLDMEARRFFIQEILKKPHDNSIDVDKVVRYISGMGGNELQRIGHEASLYAARKGIKELTQDILLEQINIIKYGTKLENKQIRDIELSMSKTAYHEAGHAVLSYILLPDIKIEQVTVAPRSESLGFVSYHNDDYIDATSKEKIFNDICVLLAGRVAKMEKYGESGMETGAVTDLEVATTQAFAAIAIYGMDEEFGYMNISGLEATSAKALFSDKIEERMSVWMDKAKIQTENEVKRLWKAIEAVALALIEKEMIDGEELKEIIEDNI